LLGSSSLQEVGRIKGEGGSQGDVEGGTWSSFRGDRGGKGEPRNEDLKLLSQKRLLSVISASAKDEMANAEVVIRGLSVVVICLGLRIAYYATEMIE